MATPARPGRIGVALPLLALALLLAYLSFRNRDAGRGTQQPGAAADPVVASTGVRIPTQVVPFPAPAPDHEDPTLPPGALRRLGSGSLRHARSVRALAFSPDGRRLFSASEGGGLALWETTTGRELWRRSSWPVTSAVFSPDGGRIYLSGGGQGTHEAIDALSGRPIFRVLGHPELARHGGVQRAFALSPDGRLMAAFGRDQVLRVRRTDSTEALWARPGPLAPGTSLAFSRGGHLLLIAEDGSIERRLALTGETAAPGRLEACAGKLELLAVAPDGAVLIATGEGGTGVWALEDGRRVWSNGSRAAAVGASRDARRWIAADRYHGFAVYQLPDGKVVFARDQAHTQALAVAISGDGRLAASGGYGGEVRLWDLERGSELLASEGHRGPVHAIAFVPAGPWIASGGDDGRLVLWDARTGSVVRSVDAGTSVDRMVLRPDGRIALAGAHAARIFDPAALEPWGNSIGYGGWGGCAFALSADGRRIARGCRKVEVWELESGRALFATQDEKVVQPFSSLALLAGGTRLVGCRRRTEQEQEMVLWDVDAGRELWAVKEERDGCGRLLAVGGGPLLLGGGYSRLWYQIDDRQRVQLSWAGAARSPFALAPDGRSLAMPASDAGGIEVWPLTAPGERADSRPPLLSYRGGHGEGSATVLAFSPDGRTLFSGGGDSTVVAWDLSFAPPPTAQVEATAEETLVEAPGAAAGRGDTPPVIAFSFEGSLASPGAVPVVDDSSNVRFVEGRFGQALHLDGELEFDGLDPLRLEASFTLELWLRIDAGREVETAAHLHLLRSPLLTLDLRSGRPYLFRHFPGGGHMQGHIENEIERIEAGRWHHLAIVHDRGAGEIRSYLGGLRLGADATGQDRFEAKVWPLRLGSSPTDSEAGFSGTIDELRVHAHVRSDEELAADAQMGRDSVRSLEAPARR